MKDPSPTLTEKNKTIFEISKRLENKDFTDHLPLAKEIYQYTNGEQKEIDDVMSRIENNEPWEYIIKEKMFHGACFYVDNSTLIPRQETETLVERVICDIPLVLANIGSTQTLRVVDIGCGSGCAGVSTLLGVESAAGYDLEETDICYLFTDLNEEALKVCEGNARNLLSKAQYSKCSFIVSDLLDNVKLNEDETVIFIANLPYIKESDMINLDPSVTDWEPKEALIGGGIDGLDIIRRFLRETSCLPNQHFIYLEMDPKQIPILINEIPDRYKKLEKFTDTYNRTRFLYLATEK